MFALALLRLLSQNRIAEFHTLLETLGESKADVLDSAEVSWVLQVRPNRRDLSGLGRDGTAD